ncbi:MAG TPA: serine/threonine-protein kinase [Polyangiaceae bacterium]|nr:serine/threonine-protein kinase [Polyangiaceae bacterium]
MVEGTPTRASSDEETTHELLGRPDVPDSGSDDLVGHLLNETYRVQRVLGEGGMGRVYLAQHARIEQKRVAIKVLHPEHALNAEAAARFRREAEAAAAISHPNVVAVFDVDRTPEGRLYIVSEYLEGIELAAHLDNVQRLPAAHALHIARQLCRGLAAAHARGVIHRDLKPQNIFLVGDFKDGVPAQPHVKVLDFGLSRFVEGAAQVQLTKTGVIMGTPSYMPPEQALGQRVDTRADIYGVGAVLYRALTGRPPFAEDTPQATVLAVIHGEPARPRSVEPSIPPELEIVLERALARDPAQRYPDMQALDLALKSIESEPPERRESFPARALLLPTPPRPGSVGEFEVEDVRSARLRLAMAVGFTVILVCAALGLAVTGLEQAVGYRFKPLELRLVFLAILGSALTPAVLWLARIRRRVWENSSRVLGLLGDLRSAVLWATASYGLGVIVLHLVNDLGPRLVRRVPWPELDPAWLGWNLVLPCVAWLVAVSAVVRRKVARSVRPGWRRLFAVGLVSAVALAALAGTGYAGVRWRLNTSSNTPSR